MLLLLYLSFMLSSNQTPNVNLLGKHLNLILDYYQKEEGLYHQTISWYGDSEEEVMALSLAHLEQLFPKIKFRYYPSTTTTNPSCLPVKSDLSIKIPKGLLQANDGNFQYHFQSNLKNIFGTLSIQLEVKDRIIHSKNEQLFTTSTGG